MLTLKAYTVKLTVLIGALLIVIPISTREGWSVEICLIGLNSSTNQRSGMILEVRIQICVSIILKAKTEKKLVDPPKRAFLSFEIKTIKQKLYSYFSFVLALKTIDTQMLF